MLVLSSASSRLLTIDDLVTVIEKRPFPKGLPIMSDLTINRKEKLMSTFDKKTSNIGGGKAQANEECECPEVEACYPSDYDTQRYSYFFDSLETFDPIDPQTKIYKPLEKNEMRITFMGSCVPPVRRAQQMMSVFVEVGPGPETEPDQFVFDCGSGVCANYGAMGIGFGRMDKVFIAHLHGDHMSDLTHIYCFGPSDDRKSPLYVWGPGPSGVISPGPLGRLYNDGTKAFCKYLREAMRWHTESFSFQTTSYEGYPIPTQQSWGLPCDPIPVGDDPPDDAYALVPIELDWTKWGKLEGDNVAYNNPKTGVKITHFPVIHCRKGSIGYKLEWNGLSMIYTSDTKPEYHSINQAKNGGNGVDVFIHEMAVPAEVWAFKNMGLTEPPDSVSQPKLYSTFLNAVHALTAVQNSSHTPQGAFGYLLSQIQPPPRLTVATHFPVADDTVACALKSVKEHCPWVVVNPDKGNITWSFDLMMLRVFQNQILQQRAVVSDYGFSPVYQSPPGEMNTPKYHDSNGDSDPYAQIEQSMEIPACKDSETCNYREDGY